MRLVLALLLVCVLGTPALAQDGARRDEGETVAPAQQPKLTAPPQLLEAAAPIYPEAAAAKGLEAEVKIRIRIEVDGTVSKVDVLTPAGHGFDEAARAAALQYKFKPAEWDGVPGPIVVETVIHFELELELAPEVEVDKPEATSDAAAKGPPSHGGDVRKAVSIQGEALERGTRRKLSGVIVSIAELGSDVVTDDKGRFFFHAVPPGSYTILAVDDKFERFQRSLDLEKDEKVEIKLYMRPKGGDPYETVVEGEREVLEVTRRTLQRRQLTTVPGTFGDPIRVIQSLPGLARTPFATGFLLIRGSNPDDSGVFIDGHRVPLLFHFLGGPSVLNAEFLDKLDLFPGGFPARYGRSIGGIVSVETRSSKSDGIHGSVDVDLLDSSGYIRFPVTDKSSLALAARRSYLDLLLGVYLPKSEPGNTLVVVPVYSDYQARYDYDFGKDGKASVFFLGSSDVLDVLSEDAESESAFALNSTIRFWRLIGKYERPIVGGLRLTLSPAIGVDSVGFAGSPGKGADTSAGLEIVSETASYRMRVDGSLGKYVYLDAGLDLESRNTYWEILAPLATDINTLDEVDVDPELFIRNFDTFVYGAYADVALNLGKLRLIPGMRLEGYLLNGRYRKSADPRIVGRYQISDEWLAKAYLGLFHQPPQPEALDAEFGNPDLELEKAVHVGAGAEWKFSKNWFADLELYYIDRFDLVEFTQDREENAQGVLEPVVYRNSRISDTIGLELLVRREITRDLYGWLSYTLSRTEEQPFRTGRWRPSAFDQRHTLNLVASYRFGDGWEAGSRFRLSTGRPDTEITGGTYDADEGRFEEVEGPMFGIRRKTFHQLDMRLEKTWTFDTWRLGFYFDLQNVLNVDNVEATQYDYRYRDQAPVTSVPFLPTIGVRGSF